MYKYYLLDWFGMLLALISINLIGKRLKVGFIVFAISNLIWIYLGLFLMNSWGIVVGNFIFMVLNLKSWINWFKLEKKEKEIQIDSESL